MRYGPTKAAILGALSTALDIVEGQPEGHALRTCLLAMRIGREVQLSDSELRDLYYAALLKDSGCSNNAVRIHKIFGGDEFLNKHDVKLIDWTSALESVKFAIFHTEQGKPLWTKLRRMLSNVGSPSKVMNEVTEARCTRGADIARSLGFGEATAQAVQHLDEHWDGGGAPKGIKGPEIPVLARILCVAQTFEVFLMTFGFEDTYAMLDKRCGTWFDPELVRVCETIRSDEAFWREYALRAYDSVLAIDLPGIDDEADSVDLDQICEAFALIIDAKSNFTWEHSSRVTEYSVMLADYFGFSSERRKTLQRAALMHDIGKLGVSTGILEKPGKLTDDEFASIKLHPRFSFEILSRVPTFDRIAEIASGHHERLDGRGYWRGLSGDQLDLDTRILTVADVFDALSAKRPYRDALPLEQVFAIMDKDAGTAFDPECIAGLKRDIPVQVDRAA